MKHLEYKYVNFFFSFRKAYRENDVSWRHGHHGDPSRTRRGTTRQISELRERSGTDLDQE